MKDNCKNRGRKQLWIMILLLQVLFPVMLLAQTAETEAQYINPAETKQKVTIPKEEKKYKKLPYSTFMTVNVGVQGDYVSQRFFNFRTPTFGLKVGTMKNTGWFIGLMSNFNFRGMFNSFKNVEPVEKNSYSYVEGTLGLTGRYCKPVSFHFGLGFYYSVMNHALVRNGVWGHRDDDMKYGPVVTAGFMFHIRNFVLSVEASGNYNIFKINETNSFQADRVGLGAKAGVGFCIPNKKRKQIETGYKENRNGVGVNKDLRKQLPL